jgi:glycosyltransferase involved in cell wall biosynthesis
MRLTVVTHFASPYQIELFDAIAKRSGIILTVIYLHRTFSTREWMTLRPTHNAVYLDLAPAEFEVARKCVRTADLAVFNYYAEQPASILLHDRARSGRAWCFWGERPGSHRLGRFAQLYRRWRLSVVHRKPIPIWGVGNWAVDAYRNEYGPGRLYVNVPYFSDISRFTRASGARQTNRLTVLYSGSLIFRKGVDVLAKAFSRLAMNYPQVRLRVLGAGPLRGYLRRKLAGHNGRVTFVGFKDWHAVPEIYKSADVLCVPSRYDGWNLVVPEGLAAGLPVIATDRTGAALDLVRPGENGWVTRAGHVSSLYEALVAACQMTKSQLDQFSELATQSVSNHTLDNGAERFCAAATASIEAF